MSGTTDIPPRARRELLRATSVAAERAPALRAEMSKPEVVLWMRIQKRQIGFRFRRQKPLGTYVADFYCHELGLVVEVDGGQHGLRENREHDAKRDAWMRERGLEVFRIRASVVLEDSRRAAALVARACERRLVELEARKAADGRTPAPPPASKTRPPPPQARRGIMGDQR